MENEIVPVRSTAPKKRTDRVAEREQQPPQRLLQNVSVVLSAGFPIRSVPELTRAKRNKCKSPGGITRNVSLQHLRDVAKKKAVKSHAMSETMKAGKPKRRPSRAITPRQISSKRSSEICRLQKQIYTELLEAKVSALAVDITRIRNIITALSFEISQIGIRIAEHSGKPQASADKRTKPEIFACSPPSSASWVTGIVPAGAAPNWNDIHNHVQQTDSTPLATSRVITNYDTLSLINGNYAALTSSLTEIELLTAQLDQTINSPTSSNQARITESEMLPILQEHDSDAAVTEQEEQPERKTSFSDFDEYQELDIFSHPTAFEPSPCDFNFFS